MTTKKTISKTQVAKLLAQYAPDHRKRLLALYGLWKNPTGQKSLAQWQLRELRTAGLVRDVGTAGTMPNSLPTYASGAELARILSAEFNSHISGVQISRSSRNDGLAGKQTNGTWRVADAVQWWRTNRASRGDRAAELAAQADTADCEKRIADSRRAKLELEEAEKVASGKWTLTTEAVAGAIGAVQKLRGFFRTAADRKFGLATVTKLRTRGFTEEQLAVVGEVCSAVGRDIVREVEGEAARFSEAQTPVQ